MVILIRCNDIVTDPRAMKYVKYIRDNKIPHRFIGWDRDMAKPDIEDAILMQMPAGYNVGGMKAAWNRIKWMFFVYKQLCKMKVRNATLHGCDVDSAFPAACYKLFHPSNKLIFDVFDWFSATLYDQNGLIKLAFRVMERFTVRHSDYVFICEEERIRQIPFKVEPNKVKVLPNIPYFESSDFLRKDENLLFDNDKLTVSYVGGFCNERCLSEIVDLAEKGVINLAIAGFGDKELEEKLDNLRDCPYIKYYGKVSYQDGLNISYNSDVMYAMYSKINPNHIYAAPNKFYEAMFLGKPLFTTKGTIVENKVQDRNTGYVSEESEAEIRDVIESISREDMVAKGCRARENWEKVFCNYTRDFLKKDYMNMINSYKSETYGGGCPKSI